MLRLFMSYTAPKIALSLLVVAALSGCGKNSSDGSNGSGVGSALNGATIIPTPYGNGLSYPFTATSVFPIDPTTGQPIPRFIAGIFPFGHASVGGSCGTQYNYARDGVSPGTFFLSFCNAQRAQPSMVNDFYGQQVFGNPTGFGNVVAGVTSLPTSMNVPAKQILGYEYDGMSTVSMSKYQQMGVPCPSNFHQFGYVYPTSCVQMVVSGVLTLSPAYIRDNMLGNAQVSRIAIDINPTNLAGTIFVINPMAGASNIVTF